MFVSLIPSADTLKLKRYKYKINTIFLVSYIFKKHFTISYCLYYFYFFYYMKFTFLIIDYD